MTKKYIVEEKILNNLKQILKILINNRQNLFTANELISVLQSLNLEELKKNKKG